MENQVHLGPQLKRLATDLLGDANRYLDPEDMVEDALLSFMLAGLWRSDFIGTEHEVETKARAWLLHAVKYRVQEIQREVAREIKLRGNIVSEVQRKILLQSASKLAHERDCASHFFRALKRLNDTERDIFSATRRRKRRSSASHTVPNEPEPIKRMR